MQLALLQRGGFCKKRCRVAVWSLTADERECRTGMSEKPRVRDGEALKEKGESQAGVVKRGISLYSLCYVRPCGVVESR